MNEELKQKLTQTLDDAKEKILYLDTETTGLDSNKCGVWQVGAIIEIDGVVWQKVDFKFNPGDVVFEQGALNTCDVTEAQIKAFRPSEEAFKEFRGVLECYVSKYDKTDKFKLVCHNLSFDFDFLLKWFQKNDDKYMGSLINYRNQFCTYRVFQAMRSYLDVPQEMSNKLGDICEYLGIELENAHDAFADIVACRELYLWQKERLERLEK